LQTLVFSDLYEKGGPQDERNKKDPAKHQNPETFVEHQAEAVAISVGCHGLIIQGLQPF